MIEDLAKIFDTREPAEIVRRAYALREAVGELKIELQENAEQKMALSRKHTLHVNEECKRAHMAAQYGELMAKGVVKKSYPELLADLQGLLTGTVQLTQLLSASIPGQPLAKEPLPEGAGTGP